MSWNGIFKEAATAGKRELTVKKDSFSEKQAKEIETWTDDTLFKVRGLNHLHVSGFTEMKALSPLIHQLNSLLELLLINNGLETLPEEVGSLSRLRLLDVSSNSIETVPSCIYGLSSLQSLLMPHNRLTAASFPPCDKEPLPSLQHLNLVGNQFAELPAFVCKCHSLQELLGSNNALVSIDGGIGQLVALKKLEMNHNQLTALPHELSMCAKLKSLSFEDNPLSDKRLGKILVQFGAIKPKAVLDYLGTKAPSRSSGKGKKKGKGKSSGAQPREDDEEVEDKGEDDVEVQFVSSSSVIRVVRPKEEHVEILATGQARVVRPYIVCTVVKRLALDDEDSYRKFITLQTKIHETVCKRRRLATIATHSLSSLSLPLTYGCGPSEKIKLQPLDRKETTTAREFISYINSQKPEAARGSKKPVSIDAQAAQLSKYVSLVDPTLMVYISDATGTVISLPPITNSEPSKIMPRTEDVLVEVTSTTSLSDAKRAMDALLVAMVESGLRSTISTGCDDVSSDATPIASCELVIEQARVVDEMKKLLVLYPARPDLTGTKGIEVIRP